MNYGSFITIISVGFNVIPFDVISFIGIIADQLGIINDLLFAILRISVVTPLFLSYHHVELTEDRIEVESN